MAIGRQVLAARFAAHNANPDALPDNCTLVQAAKAQGLSAAELAKRARVLTPTLARANRRLLDPANVPLKFATLLADALHYSITSIARYFRQPPILATSADYRSDSAPAVPEGPRMAFLESLNRDGIDAANREYWEAQCASGPSVGSHEEIE